MSHPDNNSVQVIFELSQGLRLDDETAFDRVGIRKGQCGAQCQPGAKFWTSETTRCTCNDEQLTCSHMPWSNDDFTFGTCHVSSDSHYTSFDGVNFLLDNPCMYVLSRVCDMSGLLPEFSVEVRNEKKGDSSISSVHQVNVNTHGLRVAMLRKERRRVMVNGIWRNVPLHLKENTVVIDTEENAVVLHTDFNMTVSYMRSGAVQVVLPNHYSNKVCGICGNFNQLMTDDFNVPEGLPLGYALETGKSWESHDAICEEPILPIVCTETEELEYSSDLYCGVLTSRQGPFSKCSLVLGGENFLQNCKLQMCTAHGDPEVLCHTLQTFSETCNKAGITVPAWRNSTFCPLVCGPHSHYNACVSGCQEICSSLDAAGTCGICEERCECDDGFLLSGGTCVLEEDCGCWVNEQHYVIRETFMEGDCDTLCECQGHGKIHCSPVSCLAGEVCMVQDGIEGCFPSSPVTCCVYGDPHYITFDGKAYSFWGTCNYTIVKTCGPADTQFTITARNEGRENPTSSSLNSVALDMEEFHLTIRKNKLVYVNGAPVNLPADFGSVHLSQSGPYAQVDTDFGVRMLFDGNSRLFVQVDERYRGLLCGLCGTYSGSQFDDFLTPDGNNLAHPHEFASSWNTDDNDWPCSNGSPDPPVCDLDLENAAYTECSALFGDVFTECHWFVPPQIYVTSCITDYCTYQGDKSQLCTSFEDYVSACEVAEVFPTDWRNHTFCDLGPLLPSTNAPKPTSLPESCKWSCNFDQDDCGWEQLIQDSFDWTRWSGSTPSELTGPTGDHTTGNGFYMYIEGDSMVHGDSARMMTPVCYTFEKQCVSFWYHMYGPANAMALNLYLFENNRAVKLWSNVNNQGTRWFQAKVEIKPQAAFQIIVEGIRGSDPRSDVAIDDVVIRYGGCEDIPIDDIDTTTLAPPRTSSNSVIPHPVCGLNCDFESDICSWTQLLTDVFDWTRHIGPTPTLKTGPSSDHTTGSGYYIYIEGDSATHGDTARLLSAECTDVQPQCLQFWYHMNGASSTMGLSVYQLEGNLAQEVWRRRENHGDMWHHALVDLRPTVKFHVIFEGRRGSTALSDVAIDDVSLHRGTCDDLVNQVKPTPPVPLPPTVQTTARPIQTTAEPVQTTTRPVQTTADPIQTTTRPIQTTAESIQTTTRPVHTTNESVQTTAGPIQTTASKPSCPINSYYTDCIPACQPTCSHLHGPPNCNTEEPCVQGCMCDDGFVLKQRTCVPISECGCKDSHGNIHSFGEVWYGSHCSQRCECEDDGEIECEDYECDGNEICHVTEQGQHMCQKAEFSKCTIDDDPEYRTFDKMTHKFKGKDSYILVKTTGLPSKISDVYVVTINKKVKDKSSEEDSSEEDDDDGRLRAIRIRVYNHTVEFKKGRKITVDGLSVRAPISPSGGIKIWERSSRVFLKTDFGLFVEFDGKHEAEITLSHTYKMKIGGLCGNFDAVSKNDMIKPNGEQARNVKEFGESWRVTDRRRQFFI
ncbi:zonadhesin-like [Triplophysa rosa]|uniref:zonadhesin-like n=1 Tax=Triplophysa rosa TaxID=992332 RepID=UPI002545DBC6|nr:zonadhesin-like [Triplophysa rosa]